jgi:thioredoxin-related protein
MNLASRRVGHVLTLLLGIAAMPAYAQAAGMDDSEIKHIVYPDWFSESVFFDLTEELDKASLTGKLGVMVLFTTEGCSYCHLFVRKSLGDPDLAAVVQQHFESVGMEIFDDREMTDTKGVSMAIKEFADREGAEFAPTLLFYGPDGDRMLKVVGYQSPERFRLILEYLIDGRAGSQSLAEFFRARAEARQEQAAAGAGLMPDPLFDEPPYALDRNAAPAQRPLMVLFEASDCGECLEFHTAVLSETDVRDTLAHFRVVRIDAEDDRMMMVVPDGRELTPSAWFADAGFTRTPALMFFDENGARVLQTDALVLRQRMMNSLNYVLDRAYEKGWTYQRFARSRAIERWQARQKQQEAGH